MGNRFLWIWRLSLILFLNAGAWSETIQKKEDFRTDPNWDNPKMMGDSPPQRVVQDFGYSPTHHAGGKAAGEMGGTLTRSITPAYYGKPLGRIYSMDDPLQASGTMVVKRTGGRSSLFFGFIDPKNTFARPLGWMGIMLNGEGGGCEVHVGYNTDKNQSEGDRVTGTGPRGKEVRDFNLIPVDTVYTWDFRYDPMGNEGNGLIVFTLGGSGPFTVKDYPIKVGAEHRKVGCTFDHFGLINVQTPPGSPLEVYFDDITINRELESFDRDPGWEGSGNRAEFDDYDVQSQHHFEYVDSNIAGGEKGEIGGTIFSAPDNPGYYATDIGSLSLEDRLVASGRLTMTKLGPENGFYIGWFDSKERGYPPKNLIGMVAEGPVSVGSLARPVYASSDPVLGDQVYQGPLISAFGKPHTWRIEYDPMGAGGNGELATWLDDVKVTLPLKPEARKQGAQFDRFGLAVYEGGGQYARIFLDDLEFTTGATNP